MQHGHPPHTKNNAVTGLTKGIEFLFKQNKVNYLKGAMSFLSLTKLSVSLLDGSTSEIVSSTGALDLQQVPEKMVMIGGSIIGLEMGKLVLSAEDIGRTSLVHLTSLTQHVQPTLSKAFKEAVMAAYSKPIHM
ncbi:hypothetical protein L208DRAFT_1383190 [Tricholoma matsutake]|nr:hypothetical protein L208DRAFT_1383190 [Tricholoma matsutake 945]